MKRLRVLLGILIVSGTAFAQDSDMTLSLQTDVTSFFTQGGYSIWLSGQKKRNQIQVSFENTPNAEQSFYYNHGIREDNKTLRISLAKYIGLDRWYERWYYGLNLEYVWSHLEETVTRETKNANHFRTGILIGYNWHPFSKKNSFLKNIGIMPWFSYNYRFNYKNQSKRFEITGNTYNNQKAFYTSYGVNISYNILNK